MRAYIIRRVLLLIPTVFLVSLIIFFLIRLIPGDIIDQMVANWEFVAQIDRAALEHNLGLDVPIVIQYGRWVGNIVTHGDFGNSLWEGTPVIKRIATAWPITIELGFLGLITSLAVGVPIAIYSALRQDAWGDYVARSFAIMCIAVPSFWVGTMIIVLPSIWWGYTPSIVLIPFTQDPIGNLKMFIVPALILGMSMSGVTMRITRTMMLEVLRQDYIRTAWAKGLKERAVVIRHALKNALIPVVTLVGGELGILVGGTVIIENIFCLPGMGRLLLESIQDRDYTMVSGIMLIFGVFMVLINLLVDLTYVVLDPRVSFK